MFKKLTDATPLTGHWRNQARPFSESPSSRPRQDLQSVKRLERQRICPQSRSAATVRQKDRWCPIIWHITCRKLIGAFPVGRWPAKYHCQERPWWCEERLERLQPGA